MSALLSQNKEQTMVHRSALVAFCMVAMLLCNFSQADDPNVMTADTPPTEAWTVSTGLNHPACAYYDSPSKSIFVSNASDGAASPKPSGWISKLDPSGKMVVEHWAEKLNAPQGMRSASGILWVADVDEIVGIEIRSGHTSKRIKIDGAKLLKDVAVDNDGNLYVSDLEGQKIYKVSQGKPEIFAEGDELEHPAGLLLHDELLVVAAMGNTDEKGAGPPGHLYSLDLSTGRKDTIAHNLAGALGGVELDGSGGYYVSDVRAGKIYRVSSEGEVTLLVEGFKGPADIGIADGDQLLLVPQALENKLTAYKLAD